MVASSVSSLLIVPPVPIALSYRQTKPQAVVCLGSHSVYKRRLSRGAVGSFPIGPSREIAFVSRVGLEFLQRRPFGSARVKRFQSGLGRSGKLKGLAFDFAGFELDDPVCKTVVTVIVSDHKDRLAPGLQLRQELQI